MGMGFSRPPFLLTPYLFLVEFLTAIAQEDPFPLECFNNGNFTNNSTYKSNLNNLLASLTSNTEIDYGFYNSSLGQSPDTAYALALCRGDTSPDACRSCINKSGQSVQKLCPNRKEVILGYDACTLRYSNRLITLSDNTHFYTACVLGNVPDESDFRQVLNALLENVTSRAATGDLRQKFAVGNATAPSGQPIYAMAQCTPNLSKRECINCLIQIIEYFSHCVADQGGRIVSTNCYIRYDSDFFFNPALLPQSSPLPPPPPDMEESTVRGNESNIAPTLVFRMLPLYLPYILSLLT